MNRRMRIGLEAAIPVRLVIAVMKRAIKAVDFGLVVVAGLLFTNGLAHADTFSDAPVLQHAFFGVYLGETVDSLKQRCDRARLESPLELGLSGAHMLGSPSKNKDVSSTEVSSVNDRVVQIEVQFFDNKGVEHALQALKDKYGPSDPNPSSSDGIFMYNKTSTINAEEVVIAARLSRWDENQKEALLTLTYSYKKLVEIAESRKKQQEAEDQRQYKEKQQAEEAKRARRTKTDY